MTGPLVLPLALATALLAVPSSLAQAPRPAPPTLAVAGHAGTVPIVQINGRAYVEVEGLARLAHGSLNFRDNQLTTLVLTSDSAAAPPLPLPKDFSSDFLKAGIEQMTVIREWRIAIVNAVENNVAVTDDWVAAYRRSAESRLALASAAASTDSDRSALQLLTNELANMRSMSDSFLALNNAHTNIRTDAFHNNPLDAQILACARALGSMVANNKFENDPSCH